MLGNGAGFERYLPVVMPSLLATAGAKADLSLYCAFIPLLYQVFFTYSPSDKKAWNKLGSVMDGRPPFWMGRHTACALPKWTEVPSLEILWRAYSFGLLEDIHMYTRCCSPLCPDTQANYGVGNIKQILAKIQQQLAQIGDTIEVVQSKVRIGCAETVNTRIIT
jgi:hypothetical protein